MGRRVAGCGGEGGRRIAGEVRIKGMKRQERKWESEREKKIKRKREAEKERERERQTKKEEKREDREVLKPDKKRWRDTITYVM